MGTTPLTPIELTFEKSDCRHLESAFGNMVTKFKVLVGYTP
jgi:hypothetical protein